MSQTPLFALVSLFAALSIPAVSASAPADDPRVVGHVWLPDHPFTNLATHVAVVGDRVLALYDDTVADVSIADPTNPMFVADLSYPDARFLTHTESYAHLFTGPSLLRFGSTGGPSVFPVAGFIDAHGRGDRLHLITSNSYTNLSELVFGGTGGSTPLGVSDAVRVTADDDQAYVLTDSGQLLIIDNSVIAAPVVAGSIAVSGTEIAAEDGVVFVAGAAPTEVIDARIPGAPTLAGTLPFAPRVRSEGGEMFLGGRIYDVSDPADPELIGEKIDPGLGASTIAGDRSVHAVYLTYQRRIVVEDLGDRTSDVPLGAVSFTTAPHQFHRDGGWLGVSLFESFRLVDISDPMMPTLRGQLATEGTTRCVVDGSRAYVVDSTPELHVVDLTNPDALSVTGALSLAGSMARAIASSGEFVYCAVGSGLTVVDVSDPANPTLVSEGGGIVYDAHVDGDRLYFGNGIFSLTDPAVPAPLGGTEYWEISFQQNDAVGGLHAASGALYWGDDMFGYSYDHRLALEDVSDPISGTPMLSNDIIPGDYPPRDFAFSGSYLVVSGDQGNHVYDVSDPTAPVLRATRDGGRFVVADDDLIVTGGGADREVRLYAGCGVVATPPASSPAPPALVAWPNPFRTEVTITIADGLSIDAVHVLDVAGRFVARLERYDEEPVRWDGLDAEGRESAPGVYFFRATSMADLRVVKLR